MYKKLLNIIAILTMVLLIFAGNVHAATDTKIGQEMLLYGILGDVSGDRKITSRDSDLASDHIENGRYLTIFAKKRADVNKDGKITEADVKAIKKYGDKLESELSKITDISISGPTTLKRGELIQLTATPVPNNVDNANISWSSSNIFKAIVLSNGRILGIGYGDVTIYAKIGDLKKSYQITVKDDTVAKINIKSEPNKLDYNIGDTISTFGLTLETVSKDGNTKKTVYTDFEIEPKTVTKSGKQKVTVRYAGKSTYFEITAGSLGNNNSTLINTVTSMPDTMQETGESDVNQRDWKVKILNSLNHANINQKYVNYNTQSISLYYANRILGANIDKDELSIYQNNKSKTAYWAKGNYKYSEDYNSFDEQLKSIYSELIKGYPVLMKVVNKDGKMIYVLVYGVTKTNKTRTNLSANDFRTIDPVDGKGKKLSEYYQFTNNNSNVYALVTFNEQAVQSIDIKGTKIVAEKSTTQLNAIVKNTGGVQTKIPKLMNVNWSINNTKYATIDKKGKIAGVKKGQATITVSSTLNTSIKNTCTITVNEPYGGYEIARSSDDDERIIKYFVSNINGKTYTIVNQNLKRLYPRTSDGKYWTNKCNRATALCIASSMGNYKLKDLVNAANCQPFGNSDPLGNTYFGNYGLKNNGTDFKNNYQQAVRNYVSKGNSIALYFGSSTGKTTNSPNKWATRAHWIAIIGYDVRNGKDYMYVADSGHSNSGWYPIDEFSSLSNISHVYVIEPTK